MAVGWDNTDLLEVGVVVKPHGVRGSIKIHLHNPRSDVLSQNSVCLKLPSGDLLHGVEFVGVSGGAPIIAVENVTDCDGANSLRGALVCVKKEDIEVNEGEYLYADLIGCKVQEDGREFGVVANVMDNGATDILVVRDGKKELLIPFVDEWVDSVDLERKTIELIEGDQWQAIEAKLKSR